MDPNRAWHLLRLAIREENWEEASEIAENLIDWMETKRGFPPRTSPHSDQMNEQDIALDRFVALAVAREAYLHAEHELGHQPMPF